MQSDRSQIPTYKKHKNIYWPLDEYVVIHFKNQHIRNDRYHSIAYHKNNIIGRGSYGTVYLAHPVDHDSGVIDLTTKLAVKKFRNIDELNAREATFFNSYYGQCELLHSDKFDYMVMEYISGKSIMHNNNSDSTYGLNNNLAKLDFCSRVKVIMNIMMTINLIHHDTPNTGTALVHGDINGSNILINLDDQTNSINVYIIDFGLAKELEVPQDELQPAPMVGTPLFMPKELAGDISLHGVRTDIYALTPIFACILGATDPFINRNKLRWYEKGYFETPYDFTGLCESLAMPEYPYKIKKLITRFLTRMQSIEPSNRPNSDETLQFFVKLNLFCVTYQENNHDTELPLLVAILSRLADGKSITAIELAEGDVKEILIREANKPYLIRKIDLENRNQLSVYENIISKHRIMPRYQSNVRHDQFHVSNPDQDDHEFNVEPDRATKFKRRISIFEHYKSEIIDKPVRVKGRSK